MAYLFAIKSLMFTKNCAFALSIFIMIFIMLKDKSEVDKIIAKRQPYQLLNTSREFFPSFDPSNFHKLVNESS